MNRKIEKIFAGIGAMFVLAVALSLIVAWRPGEYITNDLETGIVTTATTDNFGTTVTLSDPSPSCSFCNEDTTDAVDIRLNAIAQSIRIYAGRCYNTESNIPFFVSTFTYDAVANTPVFTYVCMERE